MFRTMKLTHKDPAKLRVSGIVVGLDDAEDIIRRFRKA